MASIEEVIKEIKRLTPEQVDEVARVISDFVRAGYPETSLPPAVPVCVLDEAIRHGWPAQLFTELIGSLPDLERATQPPEENRGGL